MRQNKVANYACEISTMSGMTSRYGCILLIDLSAISDQLNQEYLNDSSAISYQLTQEFSELLQRHL